MNTRELYLDYNHTFAPQWYTRYNWAEKEHAVLNCKECLELITSFSEKCFITFSESIISGEYIVYLGLGEQLDQFRSQLQDINVDEIENSLEFKTVAEFFNKFNRGLSLMIDTYESFIITLQNKYRLENHHYLVNAFSIKGRNRDLTPLFRVFCDIAVKVSFLDHFFASNENTIRDIIFCKYELEKQISQNSGRVKEVLCAIVYKCNYLLFKLLRAEGTENPEYLLDFKKHSLDEGTGSKELDKYIRLYNFYYKEDYSENEPELIEIRPRVLNGHLFFADFVLLAKYYKDSSYATEVQFNNLIKEFDEKYSRAMPSFGERNYDIYAIKTLKNYIYNCRLSFLLNNPDLKYERAKSEMESIRAIQNETGVFNFYPYKKIVEFYIKKLQEYLHSDNFDGQVFDVRLAEIRKEFKHLESAVKWSREIYFFPILNLYKDCCVIDSVSAIKIFTPSSYSRLVDYDVIESVMEDLKQDIRQLVAEKAIIIDAGSIKALKAEIIQAKRSSIEIFGIFTGVVALVFGGINLFSDKEIPQEVIYAISSSEENSSAFWQSILVQKAFNFASFGLSLFIFGALLYFISIPREKTLKDYFHHPKSLLFAILFGFSLILLTIVLLRQ